MTTRHFKLSHVLLPEGWRDDVGVTVDAAGIIRSVDAGRAGNGANVIAGHTVPAVANVHSHAHQRAMAGLAERSGPGADSFWTWREAMYRYALRMRPEDLEAVAAQLYVETLKSGSTVIGEFQYLHHQPDGTPYDNRAEMSLRCLAAAETAGIGITVLPALYNFGGFGGQPAADGQRRFLNDADGFGEILETLFAQTQRHPLQRLGMAPHSLRAVTAELLNEVIARLDALDGTAPVHLHVAEQVKEVEDCVAWSGAARPVEYVLDQFDVSSRWCAIHATHMTPEETDALAASGCIAGLCPTTEANLGDGIFNATRFLAAGGSIAIGSDSHITVSPAEDLRMLEYSQRLRDLSRNALAGGPECSTGRRLFDAVAPGGGCAMTQPVGAIAPGKRFDVAVLDEDHPALIGRHGDDVLDSWIFSGGNACVRDVYVAGEHMVANGRHVREDEVLAAYRAAIARLNADRE
jgi:formimidoylglutamate deiminase